MIWDLVFNREPTKPAIGKVHSHITAQRPLRSDRKHVADDEHPDHQHWIDRWPTEPRIIRCQLGMHPTQIKNRSDLAVRHRRAVIVLLGIWDGSQECVLRTVQRGPALRPSVWNSVSSPAAVACGAASRTFCSTVRHGSRRGSWKTMPSVPCAGSATPPL